MWWMLLIGLVAASEGVPESGAYEEELAEIQRTRFEHAGLHLEEASVPRVATDLTLEQGPLRLAVSSAWAFPLYTGWSTPKPDKSGDQIDAEDRPSARIGGIVFIGEAAGELAIEDRRQRLWVGNRMVLVGEEDRADWDGFVAGEPMRFGASGAIFVGTEASAVWDALEEPEEEPDVLVVAALDAKRGSRSAAQLWASRKPLLGPGKSYVNDDLFYERLGHEPIGASLLDVQTDRAWHMTGQNGVEDRYLTSVTDPLGRNSDHFLHEVSSSGRSPEGYTFGGVLGGVPFPPADPEDPLSPSLPPVRVQAKYADTTLTATASPDGLNLEIQAEQRLRFVPVGEATRVFQLQFPVTRAKKGDWTLEALTLADGRPVRLPSVNREGKAGPRATIVLPELVAPGEEIRLLAEWRTTWPLERGLGTLGSLGASTGMVTYLPTPVPDPIGNPWRFTTRVRIPRDADFTVALGGKTLEQRVEGRWQVTETRHTKSAAMWPVVALGKWDVDENPPAEDLPAVTTMLLEGESGDIRKFGPEVRRVVSFYQRYLPHFPVSELKIFQAPDGVMGMVWIAPHGMVNLQKARRFNFVGGGSEVPNQAAGILAHEIAHQYWGHVQRPAQMRDFWMAESLAETFACLYVGAAFGLDSFRVRMEAYRSEWEQMPAGLTASLVRAYDNRGTQAPVVYHYGPYVLHAILRPKIGDEAFFSALDVMLRDHYEADISTEMLEHYFEAAHGEPLDDFFEYWVHSGFIPDLKAEWTAGDQVIRGTLTSSVPYGTVEVPLAVTSKGGEPVVTWVKVVDGRSSFEVPYTGPDKKLRVVVDPDGRVLARSRKSRRQ